MKEETFGETERIIGNWFEKTKKETKLFLQLKFVVMREIY